VSDNWQDQVTDFFDGSSTDEELLRLNQWIKSDPQNVRRFVREAIVHSYLHDLLSGEESMRQHDEQTALISGETMILPALSTQDESEEIERALPSPPVVMPQLQPVPIVQRRWFWAASIMIPLLVGFVIYRFIPRPPALVTVASAPRHVAPEPSQVIPEPRQHESAQPVPIAPPPSFASVVATVNAQWGGSIGQLQSGQRLPNTALFLKSGFAEITFDSGATMIVEAPARFQVQAVNSIELTSGQISAKVPAGAHGFAVETATTRIIDLGTEFGVAISPDGSNEIQVFKGNVRAQSQDGGLVAPLALGEGQAAVSKGHEIKLDPAGAQPQAFVRSLIPPASIDIVDLICGGDGTTHLRSGAIDQRTGELGRSLSSPDTAAMPSDYHPVHGLQVVDGCFVPNGTNVVDSKRQTFDFGATNGKTLYKILAGGRFPWPVPGETFTAVLGGVDYSEPQHGLILVHPNVGITFDLAAIRRLHPGFRLADFRAVVGNTCLASPRSTKGHVFVLVDGVSRSDLPDLTAKDGAVNLRVALADADRFLTIAITDNRKTVSRNWVILGDPQLE